MYLRPPDFFRRISEEELDHEIKSARPISTVQKYEYGHHGKYITVDLTQIPELSESTQKIISNLRIRIPPLFKSSAPLVKSLQKIQLITQMIQNAQDTATQRKRIAMMKTALSMSLLIGSILALRGGFYATGVALLLAQSQFNLHLIKEVNKEVKEIEDLNPDLPPNPLEYLDETRVNLFGGMNAPMIQASRQSRQLKRVLVETHECTLKLLDEYDRENCNNCSKAQPFYELRSKALLSYLPERPIDEENRKARRELTQIWEFSQTFNRPEPINPMRPRGYGSSYTFKNPLNALNETWKFLARFK